jgi:Xaa-Pro dipeptidase
MKARIEKIFRALPGPIDALVIANAVDPHLDHTFFYLFDVPSGLFEGSVAVAHPDGGLDVVTSPLEAESAHEAAKADPHVRVHSVTRDETGPFVQKLLGGATTLGLNYGELTHGWFLQLEKMVPKAKWVDASAAIRTARATKDASEIARLRKAAEIGSAVGREIPSMLRAGMTELELAAEMEYRMNRLGAGGRSFATIVGFGPHGAEPHFSPGEARLVSGQSIVCDFGAYYRRYASDITRSFHFGTRDEEMKRVHETVEKAQAAALAEVRAGGPGKAVHDAAARVIEASPWKGRFTHGVGHMLGLAVHDGAYFGPSVEAPLEAGMVLTVEPGIYLPGKGGVRIEDDVLVTRTGFEFLSTTPREYLEVAA